MVPMAVHEWGGPYGGPGMRGAYSGPRMGGPYGGPGMRGAYGGPRMAGPYGGPGMRGAMVAHEWVVLMAALACAAPMAAHEWVVLMAVLACAAPWRPTNGWSLWRSWHARRHGGPGMAGPGGPQMSSGYLSPVWAAAPVTADPAWLDPVMAGRAEGISSMAARA